MKYWDLTTENKIIYSLNEYMGTVKIFYSWPGKDYES